MPKKVHVRLGKRSYKITVGRGLAVCGAIPSGPGTRAMVVSDSNVAPIYAGKCLEELRSLGIEAHIVVVPAGEASKSRDQLFFLYDMAADLKLDRSSVVVALGGGMVGDLAGFAAATYLRGIRLVQVPTTLLAMVDSSVGGKTGINLERGKNLVGAFHQPVEVVADLSTLDTLPQREYVSGLAEVVKYGVISDADLFELLEKHSDAILARDSALLEGIVARCCAIKAGIVTADEREGGLRAVLNFGHTLGHAVEKVGGYGKRLHGEAVAIGMAYAVALSVKARKLPRCEADRVVRLLKQFGLPVKYGGSRAWPALRAAMAADKKVKTGIPRFVLVERLGSAIIGCDVAEKRLEGAFMEAVCPE